MDELDDGLAHLNDLDGTWGFDLDAFLQERAQQAPAAGEARDGTAETMDSSEGTSSAPMGRAETTETMGSSQGVAVDASSVPAGRAGSNPGAASASDTGQGNCEDPPAALSGRPAHELSQWGQFPPTVRGRTRAQSQRLEGELVVHQLSMNDEVADACDSVRVMGDAWEYPKAYTLDDGGPIGLDGRRTCCGK